MNAAPEHVNQEDHELNLNIGGITLSKNSGRKTVNASISFISQDDFEKSLSDVFKWLLANEISEIIFESGGSLFLPEWFIEQCKQAGVQVIVSPNYKVNHLTHLGNLTNILLIIKIEDWKKYPNALGSESQVAVLLGELSAFLNEPIPDSVLSALKTLSLRGTMRDIASAIKRERFNPNIPSFHDVVDTAAISCGLSWTEALTIIVTYLEKKKHHLSTRS